MNPKFNFHAFFDFDIPAWVPLLVEGYEVSDSPIDPPTLVELWNAHRAQAVVYFVRNGKQLEHDFNDPDGKYYSTFTIKDLMTYKPLFGHAWFYPRNPSTGINDRSRGYRRSGGRQVLLRVRGKQDHCVDWKVEPLRRAPGATGQR